MSEENDIDSLPVYVERSEIIDIYGSFLLRLPIESILNIFLFTDPDDFKSGKLTCKIINQILEEQYFIYSWFAKRGISDKIWKKYYLVPLELAVMKNTLKENMEIYYNRVLPELQFIKICQKYHIDGIESVFYTNEYLQIPPLQSGELIDLITKAYDVITCSIENEIPIFSDFIDFITLFIHLYLHLLKIDKKVIQHITKHIFYLGKQLHLAPKICRFIKKYYHYLDWDEPIPEFLKCYDGIFFSENPDLITFIGIDKLLYKVKLPELILQDRLNKEIGENSYIMFINILTYQKPSEEFIRRNSSKYNIDEQLKHVALRYCGVWL
jgi:hypothetical protein